MSAQTDTNQGYSIMEAAKLSGLPGSTLRYYETIGIINPISRNLSSRHRMYNEDDINIIIAIACLNATGMSIEDMPNILQNNRKGAQAAEDQIELLMAQRHRLADEERYLRLRQRYVEIKIAYWHAIAAGNEGEAAAISKDGKAIARELKLPSQI